LVDLAEQSERAGVDLMWIPDEELYRDPFAALSAIASHTGSIELGLGITNPYTRHPVQVARAMATVQDYRSDPLIIGLGAGLKHTRQMLASPEGRFVDVTRDAIVAMKRLFAGDSVSMDNSVFRIDRAKLDFRPRIVPKIYVATTHPDAFQMAGEVADGVIVGNVAEPEAFRAVVGFVEEGLNVAGRQRHEISIVAWNMTLTGDDTDHLADTIRDMVAKTITASHSKTRKLQRLDPGKVAEIVGHVKNGRFPIQRELIPNEMIAKLAFLGKAEECAERILRLENAGADMIGIRPVGSTMKTEDYDRNIFALNEAFRRMPSLRE
jgi:5,10-methylenetetrahydromethanopterin reductase